MLDKIIFHTLLDRVQGATFNKDISKAPLRAQKTFFWLKPKPNLINITPLGIGQVRTRNAINVTTLTTTQTHFRNTLHNSTKQVVSHFWKGVWGKPFF